MRTKNAFKIIMASTLLQIVVVISGLILPRLFLEEYGSEVNGLVTSIKQFATYFSIVGAGLAVASNAALYKPIAENDYNKINGILSATAKFFRQTGYMFMTLIVLLAIIYPNIIEEDISHLLVISLIIIIGVGAMIEHTIISKYKVILMADQKNYVISNIVTQGTIINVIISIIFIKLHFSVISVLIIGTIIYVFRLILMINYVKKSYSYISFKEVPDDKAISGRWDAFAYQVSGIIITYTPIIIITIMIDLKAVSVYSIYNMVFSSLGMIVTIFSAGFSASFGDVIARKQKKVLNKSFNTYEYIFFTIMFFCYTCALKLIIPFIKIYTRGINDVDYILPSLGFLFVISGLVRNIRTPSVTLVEAAGKYKENRSLNIIESILNVIFSIIFVLSFGINGVLIAYVLTGSIRTILYMKYTNNNILNRSYKKVFIRILVNIIAMLIVMLIPFEEKSNSFIGWIVMAIKVGLTSLVIIISMNSFYDIEGFKDVLSRIKGFNKSK